jgi:hypothetical protein
MILVYGVLGGMVAVAGVMAVTRDLMDRRAGHRSRRFRLDPTGARLGGPTVNLDPNLPRSDRDA